jgi:sugar phosphate isomerase/epimerase
MTLEPLFVLPSTTSHKHEPLDATLEIFSRLEMRDLDLTLHHVIDEGVSVGDLQALLARGRQQVWIVSGGWCDFYEQPPRIEETFQSVDRQVAIGQALGVARLRLFFGWLKKEAYGREALAVIARNLQRLSDRHPGVDFAFENHDGASLCPATCREILETVGRPNIRMNFDPVNFERAGVSAMDALGELAHLVVHVHLKGLDGGEYCEFGAGTLDLVPVLKALLARGYRGGFTVEYEGRFDRTLRLYRSLARARTVIAKLTAER